MNNITYEQSVNWLRTQDNYAALVKLCYLDEDNFIAAKRFYGSEEFAEVKNYLKLNKGNKKLKILDLGCGNGIASYSFASLGHDVTAVDPDASADVGLEAAKRLSLYVSNGSISITQAFAESLPFADETFDIVYARQSLHHFSDLQQGVTECSRVLKKHGLFFATREHIISDKNQLQQFLENHILHQLHGGENAYLLKDYTLVIHKAGFKILNCLGSFDSVINHYPTSNTEIKAFFSNVLERKFGKLFKPIFIKSKLLETKFRQRLSHSDNAPGRLYSFLCIKL
ncbi:class I SAM-dependent methyltransferase [Nostoc sp. MS1]|uniref:class I SAM-dependent methyltransferase n=1 Tax=Nostoc sp. MS1 TaxID=2764711 RepID=UPI001CC58B38|nr:class I SAM-dependent methyltransferase [Nostoc sp. MS1]BCL35202.1 hypothetical protein NSMS1_16490 [Nostoc sp. MS1]